MDAGEFDVTKAVADTFAAVVAARDRIAQLPTWPWPPRLLRGLLSALLLPVVVDVVSRGVGSLLGT